MDKLVFRDAVRLKLKFGVCLLDNLQKQSLLDLKSGADTCSKLVNHELQLINLHHLLALKAIKSEEQAESIVEGCSSVQDQHGLNLKHVYFKTLLQPLQVIQLDFCLALRCKYALFEVFRRQEKRLSDVLPPRKHLRHHIDRDE